MTAKALLQSAGDGTAVAAGYIGQYVESGASATQIFSATDNQFNNVATLSLPQGVWRLSGACAFDGSANTSGPSLAVTISQFSGNTQTDHVYMKNYMTAKNGVTGGTAFSFGCEHFVSLSSTTTIYLKAYSSSFGVSPQIFGHLRAVRIA